MSSTNVNREVAYTRAIQICQNLATLTAYELIGGQILFPKEEEGTALRPSPLVLLPVVDEPSTGAIEAVAKIGTTFVAIKSTLDAEGNQQIEFAVFLPKNGKTTLHGNLRAWGDRKHRIFLVPDANENEDIAACFQFNKGLRQATQPWTDKADLERGLELASMLLLSFEGKGTDSRHG